MHHADIALAIQLAIWLVTGDLLLGAVAASMYFIGREVAQAEERCIGLFYNSKRANAPIWCGFEPRAWNKKGLLDWIVPTLVCFIIYYFF